MGRKTRCERCWRILRRCICKYLSQSLSEGLIEHRLKLILIQSHSERDHIKNSGALLMGSLAHIELIEIQLPSPHLRAEQIAIYEEKYKQLEAQLSTLLNSPYALLYPQRASDKRQETEQEITQSSFQHFTNETTHQSTLDWSLLSQMTPPQLVILDLTWSQSERLLQLIPRLADAPRLTFNSEMMKALHDLDLRSYQELRSIKLNSKLNPKLNPKLNSDTRCSTFEAGIAALASYDYHLNHLNNLENLEQALSQYQQLWSQYRSWVRDLSNQFKRN